MPAVWLQQLSMSAPATSVQGDVAWPEFKSLPCLPTLVGVGVGVGWERTDWIVGWPGVGCMGSVVALVGAFIQAERVCVWADD